jgi:CDP-diacylglycerol--glycerol-3-phosphate 3-phosphatidyltransferase
MKMRDFAQQTIYKGIDPVVRGLIKLGITPNIVTATGLFINVAAAAIFIYGTALNNRGNLNYVGLAGAVILFAGLFDMLDGQVARIGKTSSRYGALFDSVLDRYSELIVLFGICYYLIIHDYFFSSIFAFVALIGSVMVSYIRARAEGLGIECKGGFMQRPERVIAISAGSILCGIFYFFAGDFKIYVSWLPFPIFEPIVLFVTPILIVAIFSNITAIGRLNHCRKVLKAEENRMQ